MAEIFENLYDLIFEPIVTFLNEILISYTKNGFNLSHFTFKIGFGSIEWFSMDLETLFILIGGLIIVTVFTILVFKGFIYIFKSLATFGRGLFRK